MTFIDFFLTAFVISLYSAMLVWDARGRKTTIRETVSYAEIAVPSGASLL